MDKAINEARHKMEKSISALQAEMVGIRGGRATGALLQNVKVDYYGTPTPLLEIAAVATPEPRLMVVKPYDPSAIKEVSKAIQAANLGFNPSVEGAILRIAVPPLSEDRRRDLVKNAKGKGETTKVALRNVRRDALAAIQKMKKDGAIPEDLAQRGEKQVQELVDKYSARIEELLTKKEKEIMEV